MSRTVLTFAWLAVGCTEAPSTSSDSPSRIPSSTPTPPEPEPEPEPEPVGWHGLAVWYEDACALRADDTLFCWGRNYDQGLVAVPPGGWRSAAMTDSQGCGLRLDGTIECWGCLGGGELSTCDAPPGQWERITGNGIGYCVTGANGIPACWGYQKLAVQAPEIPLVDLELPCSVDALGTPVCWGLSPEVRDAMTLTGPFRTVRHAGNYWCGITLDDLLLCEPLENTIGVPPAPPDRALDADVDYDVICAILPDRTLYCSVEPPDLLGIEEVPPGEFVEIEVSSWAMCAIDVAGHIVCWGDPGSALVLGAPAE